MIYLKVDGGLCNRMRAIASAYSLAQIYDTDVKVFWTINSGCRCSSELLFSVPEMIEIKNSTRRSVKYPSRFKCSLKGTAFIGLRWKDRDKVADCLKDGKDVYIETSAQFWEVDYNATFVFSKRLSDKSNDLLANAGPKLIGLHLRRTDCIQSINSSPTELFTDAIKECLSENKDAVFFLATDSKDDENELMRLFPDKIICNSARELSRDSEQGIKDACVDLICLSKCTKIYGSFHSSFSEVASQISNIPLIVLKKDQIT